jgi:hypothetical protein
MAFKVEFATDSAAFSDDFSNEVSRILCKLGDEFRDGWTPSGKESGPIKDVNGNTVGGWEYVPV